MAPALTPAIDYTRLANLLSVSGGKTYRNGAARACAPTGRQSACLDPEHPPPTCCTTIAQATCKLRNAHALLAAIAVVAVVQLVGSARHAAPGGQFEPDQGAQKGQTTVCHIQVAAQ